MSEFHAHLAHAHLTEDALEEYALNRLPEAELELFEEHLLLCGTCQERLQEVDEYIRAIKAGMVAHKSQTPSLPRIAALRVVAPKMFWPAAFALLLFLTAPELVKMRGLLPTEPAHVELAAFRDGESTAEGPADRALDLSIEAADLPVFSAYRITVVTAAGENRWSGTAAAEGGKLLARVPKRLPPGVYWVRLSAAQGELLREFGLRVR